jgi:hypothetical protein
MGTIAVQSPPPEIRSVPKYQAEPARNRTRSGPEDRERKCRGDHRDELEDQQREMEAVKAEVGVVEPAEPGQERPDEDDDGEHGREREQARCDWMPVPFRGEREHEADGEHEQGEQGETRRAVVICQHAEQRPGREEDREPAQVGKERGTRPGDAKSGVHARDHGARAGRRC